MTIKVYIRVRSEYLDCNGTRALRDKGWLNKVVEFEDFNDLFYQVFNLLGVCGSKDWCEYIIRGASSYDDADFCLEYENNPK